MKLDPQFCVVSVNLIRSMTTLITILSCKFILKVYNQHQCFGTPIDSDGLTKTC